MTAPLGAIGADPASTKLGFLRAEVIEAASAAALAAAVNTWLASRGEERLVDLEYVVLDTTHYSVVIWYTE